MTYTIHDIIASGDPQFQFSDLKTFFDDKRQTSWLLMDGQPRGSFTKEVLEQSHQMLDLIINEKSVDYTDKSPGFMVYGSARDGVFSRGGDLAHFSQCIEDNAVEKLKHYGEQCVKGTEKLYRMGGKEIFTIALVQGDALGGGFECALSCQFLVAERGAKFGFPEPLFNLFPGMGAWSALSRKVGQQKAKKLLSDSRMYTAEELYELELVDVLAAPGKGVEETIGLINRIKSKPITHKSVRDIVRQYGNYMPLEELIDITHLWASNAVKISDKDIRMMRRLVSRQDKV